MEDTKRSLIAESAVRQLKLYGFESKDSGDENYERFRHITYSEDGLRLQELIQKEIGDVKPMPERRPPIRARISSHQQRELQTILPVIWKHVQELSEKQETGVQTVLLIYGSSVLCIEICRPVNPDVDAPSPDQYGEQLFELEKQAVNILEHVTGRRAAATAIEMMALFGVKDSHTEQENLSLFASVSTTQNGEALHGLVQKQLDQSSASSPQLLMNGILSLMWGTIEEIAKDDPEEMQFVLMMYGSAVLVTELQRKYEVQELNELEKEASEFVKQKKLVPPTFQESKSEVSKLFSSATSMFSNFFSSSKVEPKTDKKEC